MIRGIIYLLVCTYLYVLTPLNQFSKLPDLFAHFQQHAQAEDECTFYHFLAEHYWNESANHDNDQSEDRRLPFKNYEVSLPPVIALVPNHAPICLHSPEFARTTHTAFNDRVPNQLWESSFFQPPCVA